MPTVLIVDNDADERSEIMGLFEGRSEYSLLEASQDDSVLAAIADGNVDLVLLDAQREDLLRDGLLGEIAEEFPRVPVILITVDSEDPVSVDALVLGAATYVPRSSLARDLVVTVDRMLGLAGCRRAHARLLECLSTGSYDFVLHDNDIDQVTVIIGHLVDTAVEFGLCTERQRMQIGVALDEAIMNGIVHGNLEISSRLLETGDDTYHREIDRRRKEPPYRERRLFVSGRFELGHAEYRIRDEGPGFEPQEVPVPNPTSPEHVERPHGRGLFLIKAFMSEVSFNEEGNEITMIRRGVPRAEPR